MLTKQITANGLIKALLNIQKHKFFMRMTGIEDQKDLLAFIKKEENILQQLQTNPEYNEVYGFSANTT